MHQNHCGVLSSIFPKALAVLIQPYTVSSFFENWQWYVMLKLTSSCILMAYVSEIEMGSDELALIYFRQKLHNEVKFTDGNMQTIINAR